MIVVLGQNVSDVPHAMHAIDKISQMRPDTVLLEVPTQPFQPIFDRYWRGRLGDSKLVSEFSKIVKKELDIDKELIQKFREKEVGINELKELDPQGSLVYVVMQTKKSGIPIHAVDVPLDEVESEVKDVLKYEQSVHEAALGNAYDIMSGKKPDVVMRIAHVPFHAFELVIGHHPERNPMKHSAECKICRLGVSWERLVHQTLSAIVNILPFDKTHAILRHFDIIRERKIAENIERIHEAYKNKLGHDPHVLVIVHIWHEAAIEGLLLKKGLRIVEVE